MCESCITFLNETLTSEEYDAVEDIKSFEDLRRKQEVHSPLQEKKMKV